MVNWFVRFGLLASVASLALPAQEVRVRAVDAVTMPAQADSNSPVFWRNNRFYWFNSTGRILLSEGADQFGPHTTSEIEISSAFPAPHWMESAWMAEDGMLWGWYHAEPVGLVEGSAATAPLIGAMWSSDGGRTFQDMGVVLQSGEANDATAQNGFFIGGNGDFSVIPNQDRTYFYFFFGNYGGPPEAQGICVARMAYADRFTPAGRIWKYNNGKWEEPGLLGRATPIFPVRRSWMMRDPDAFWGPSVHWNTYLQCYVMLMNHAAGEPGWSQEGIYVSFCTDLEKPDTWTEPVRILDSTQVPAWSSFYPQVVGLDPGDTDARAGKTARLYLAGISNWEIDFYPKTIPTEVVENPTSDDTPVTSPTGPVPPPPTPPKYSPPH